MNTLADDFNEFVSRRLSCTELKVPARINEFTDSLEKTLNQEQLKLFIDALSFEADTASILEENAYRQGFLDGISILLH